MAERLSRVIPRKLARSLFSNLAYWYAARSPDLEAIKENMRAAIGKGAPDGEITGRAREMVAHFTAYLVDLFYSTEFTRDFIQKHVSIQGLERLDEALGEKKGVILASAHLGNWELGGMTLARMGYPVMGVALRHKDPEIAAIFQKMRDRSGLQVVFFGDSLKSCYTALTARNTVLGLVGDRLYEGGGVETDFFGKKVSLPRGIARISLFTGSPILPAFFVSTGRDRYLLEIMEPLKGTDERFIMQGFARRCEEVIRRYPSQWFIFQRFWEKPEWPA